MKTFRFRQVIWTLCIFVSASVSGSAARAQPPQNAGDETPIANALVAAQRGQLPIILSAPHGGEALVPGASERKGIGLPKGPKGFFTGRDTGTEQFAIELAAALEARLGKKPYYVVARFHRKFIDPNRPAKIAYEAPEAKAPYDAYHQTLAQHCREVQRTFGRGLLLDLHGQGSARDTIFRGTQHGKTVTLLIQRFGEQAHNGPQSFFGLLEAAGCKVYTEKAGKERAGFTGGYIVQTYGSHGPFGIDAIQLEMGADYRTKDKRKAAIDKLVNAIEAFSKLYLPAAPLAAPPTTLLENKPEGR